MGEYFLARAFAPVIFTVALLFGSEAIAGCVKWSNSPSIIKKNGLMKPGPVRAGAIGRGDDVISIDLCRRGGGYVYRLTVLGKKKRVRDIVIDARSGKRIGGRSSKRKKLKNRIINRVKRNLRRHGINYY
ncbi:MAG: hypothetical protein GY927_08930 [bacterium]|nr:hypothetical protein [bacterium]